MEAFTFEYASENFDTKLKSFPEKNSELCFAIHKVQKFKIKLFNLLQTASAKCLKELFL